MDRGALKALARLWDVPVALAIGLALALLVVFLFSEARVMPLLLRRTVEVQRHLASGAGAAGGVVVLGSSVVLEGVDCRVVARELPAGAPCENLGWTGANPRQLLLVEPALRSHPPRALLLGIDLFGLLDPDPMPPDLLTAAAWWDFVPAAELDALAGLLGDEELAALRAPRHRQLLRFRSFPLDALDEQLREVARSDLRFAGYATNFTDPWISRGPLAPVPMARHVEQLTARARAVRADGLEAAERVLEHFLAGTRRAAPETRVLLVLTPLHPALEEAAGPVLAATRDTLAALAQRIGASFVDHSGALPFELFSDALHPDAEGRAVWSQRLGEAVAARLAP